MEGTPHASSLRELALLFLRLGTIAFGGPAAHVGVMRDEIVVRRRWLEDARFLDLLGATNLIPGPNSTELAIHIGYERRGWAGLAVAGACFILPSALLAAGLAALYMRFGARPEADALLYGVRPVMLAIVLQAIWGLAPRAAHSAHLRVIGALALALALAGIDQLWILFASAALALLVSMRTPAQQHAFAPLLALGLTSKVVPVALPTLFVVFLKVGSVLFGSGYVLLSLLRAELVTRLGWISERALLDAIVVGQVTPGPLFTTATFIGYLLRGGPGAVVATLGIFLPAFVFVALSHPFIARLRSSRVTSALLDGVNVASVALMAAVVVQLARSAIVDVPSALVGIAGALLSIVWRVSTSWLVLSAAALGILLRVVTP